MSLVILFFIALYIAVLVAATVLPYKFGLKRGWARPKCRLAATGGFLLVFLPVFWDWIPTIWLHSYYCEKYSGLTVYKTLEQWTQENPGAAATLVRQKPPLQVGPEDHYYYQLNQRFRWEVQRAERPFGVRRRDDRIVDSSTGTVVAQLTDFSTGIAGPNAPSRGFRDIKVWMNRNYCEGDGNMVSRKEFAQLRLKFETLGGQQ